MSETLNRCEALAVPGQTARQGRKTGLGGVESVGRTPSPAFSVSVACLAGCRARPAMPIRELLINRAGVKTPN